MAEIASRAILGHAAASFERARLGVGVGRPASVRQMFDLYRRDLTFSEDIVTDDGVALGASHQLLIRRNGSFVYAGHFRATGFPSFDCSLLTTLRFHVFPPDAPPITMQAAFSANGRVHGTNEPGDREHSWTTEGVVPLLASEWEGVRVGQVSHDLQFNTDWFGPAGDIAGFVAQVLVAGATAGAAGVAIVLAGETAGALDLNQLVLPGIIGVVAAAGAGFVLGPGAMIPAFIVGAAVTAATVRQRPLEDDERRFADAVFGGQIDYDRVLLTNLVGAESRPFTVPGPGELILINIGKGFDDPVHYTGKGGDELGINAPGQLLIHELTHAWQIQHAAFVPEYFCRAASTSIGTVGGNNAAYGYGPPTGPWNGFGTEAQGSVIDQWFAGSSDPDERSLQRGFPPMQSLDAGPGGNPYFRYVRDNIRAGVA